MMAETVAELEELRRQLGAAQQVHSRGGTIGRRKRGYILIFLTGGRRPAGAAARRLERFLENTVFTY